MQCNSPFNAYSTFNLSILVMNIFVLFQLLATRNKASINIPLCVFGGFKYAFLYSVYLGIRLLNLRSISLTLVDTTKHFPNGVFWFKNHTNNVREFQMLWFLKITVIQEGR